MIPLPEPGHKYGIGADPAEGNPTSDDSALCVRDQPGKPERKRAEHRSIIPTTSVITPAQSPLVSRVAVQKAYRPADAAG
jgi:hypothetical protein